MSCGVPTALSSHSSREVTRSITQDHIVRFLRPRDVVPSLPDATVHLLDAKFRLQWMKGAEGDGDRALLEL